MSAEFGQASDADERRLRVDLFFADSPSDDDVDLVEAADQCRHDQAVRLGAACPVHAGSDPCCAPAGHDGDHWTYWGKPADRVRPVMYWRGDEPWSHQ